MDTTELLTGDLNETDDPWNYFDDVAASGCSGGTTYARAYL
jgi:hypothetical protein